MAGHVYEFGGPIGAFGLSFGLPILVYLIVFVCNDVSGCPAPSTLHPYSLTLDKLKKDVGWQGFSALITPDAFAATVGYYLLSLVLNALLPAQVIEGTELRMGGRLKYRFNAFSSAMFITAICVAGTVYQGAHWAPWVYIDQNYVPILASNLIISFVIACYVYVASFSVKPGNKDKRELAAGGLSGNIMYDWFIGRELNPRITFPLVGEVDIKSWLELRPGMLGWIILDCAFMTKQWRNYGTLSNSIIFVTVSQVLYVFDALWNEPAILTTIDITTDGFGFMLSFGDLVWVPFTFSLQARYLSVYPLHLGVVEWASVIGCLGTGYYIFRSANNEKNRFRNNPNDPKVAHLKYIETGTGSRLLTSGWWGTARHINYLGDWIMSWAYCLPTGIAGYIIERHVATPGVTDATAAGSYMGFLGGQSVRVEAVPGKAKGWGMLITYFYIVYFAILLIHRELRDEHKCKTKYGKDWDRYTKQVPWRIVPGIY